MSNSREYWLIHYKFYHLILNSSSLDTIEINQIYSWKYPGKTKGIENITPKYVYPIEFAIVSTVPGGIFFSLEKIYLKKKKKK